MSIPVGQNGRCPWCGTDPLYVAYHDTEWGVPVRDSRALFAKLVLDGAQAGLAWITILRKRAGYYAAFDQLDPEKVSRFTDRRLARLMDDPRIVRNRLKIASARQNARAWLALADQGIDFSEWVWGFVGGAPKRNRWVSMGDVPAVTPEAEAMSKALKAAGFNFVGPTILYAFMQAVGMVNDHLVSCPRHVACARMTKRR